MDVIGMNVPFENLWPACAGDSAGGVCADSQGESTTLFARE